MEDIRDLTEIEQLLMGFLVTSSAQRGTRVLVLLLLQEENKQLEMCRFLSKNLEATEDEILKMAQQIAGTQS